MGVDNSLKGTLVATLLAFLGSNPNSTVLCYFVFSVSGLFPGEKIHQTAPNKHRLLPVRIMDGYVCRDVQMLAIWLFGLYSCMQRWNCRHLDFVVTRQLYL